MTIDFTSSVSFVETVYNDYNQDPPSLLEVILNDYTLRDWNREFYLGQ